jgi:hypothetical protein
MMEKRDAMLAKVRALMKKTQENGCTEEEELSALAKARAWIDAYEISDTELQLTKEEKATLFTEDKDAATDTHKIKSYLGRAVEEFCNVRIYRMPGKDGLSIIGLPSDIAWATFLLEHLADYVHHALFEFLIDSLAPQAERKLEIRGFVVGCCGRISERMRELCKQSETVRTSNGKALVIIKNQAIAAYMKTHGIHLTSSGGSRAACSDSAIHAGRSAGEGANFGRPVSGAGAVLRIGK